MALAVYLALQGFRLWVLRTLGARGPRGSSFCRGSLWCRRALSLSVAPELCGGCRRDRRAAAGVRSAAGSPRVFTVLNAAVLAIRIRAENRALAGSRKAVMCDPS